MTDTYVVAVRRPEKLLALLAKGLFSGDVLAVHKVREEDVAWLRPEQKKH